MTGQQDVVEQEDPVAKEENKAQGFAEPREVAEDPTNGKSRGRSEPAPDQLLRAAFARASQVFGQAVSIFMQSPQHRNLLLSDLEWRVIRPIALRQSDFCLRPRDWKCGDRLWTTDVVAPVRQAQGLIKKLKAEVFGGRESPSRYGGGSRNASTSSPPTATEEEA